MTNNLTKEIQVTQEALILPQDINQLYNLQKLYFINRLKDYYRGNCKSR